MIDHCARGRDVTKLLRLAESTFLCQPLVWGPQTLRNEGRGEGGEFLRPSWAWLKSQGLQVVGDSCILPLTCEALQQKTMHCGKEKKDGQ